MSERVKELFRLITKHLKEMSAEEQQEFLDNAVKVIFKTFTDTVGGTKF